MSPLDARALVFATEAERDWEGVLDNLRKAGAHDPGRGGPESAWVALALDHAYSAFEAMLVRLERGLCQPERAGAAWHRALLLDAARPIEGLRPAVVPAEVLADWLELLGFRHFLRHAYRAELDPRRLAQLVERLERAVRVTEPCIAAVLAALRSLS
jgi:hypothetical protein